MAKHTIKILGKGCSNCIRTEQLVREVVALSGVDVGVEKVTKTSEMVSYRVMSTPAVVIDEHVVHAGGIPTKAEVEQWILALQA
jgi:small redox-active disulfide protein 2